jgi:hypothetical protein
MPLDDMEAEPLLTSIPVDERDESWRLAQTDGTIVGDGGGLVELADAMRLTRPAARLLGCLPDRALERLYRMVAGRRGPLGRLVPDGRAPRRFP